MGNICKRCAKKCKAIEEYTCQDCGKISCKECCTQNAMLCPFCNGNLYRPS